MLCADVWNINQVGVLFPMEEGCLRKKPRSPELYKVMLTVFFCVQGLSRGLKRTGSTCSIPSCLYFPGTFSYDSMITLTTLLVE